jgi:rubredoxin
MSLFSHVLRLRVEESNEGVHLVWKCPRCDAPRDFSLVVSNVKTKLLVFNLSRPATLADLRCTKCQYEFKVPGSELEQVSQARAATELLKSGALTTKEYETQIQDIPATFVKDLVALTQNWKCRKCGESNPITFESCWNCQATGEFESTPNNRSGPLTDLPRGGNPWE